MAYAIPDPRFEAPELLTPGKKPVGNVVIDFDQPLSRGLIEFYLCKDYRSLFNRNMTADSLYVYPSVNKFGQELELVDTNSSTSITLDPFIPDSSPITILMAFRTDITLSSTDVFFKSDASASIISRLNASGDNEFIINSLTNDRVSHSLTINIGEKYVVGGSWGGDGTFVTAISETDTNGIQITANASTATGTYTNTDHLINRSLSNKSVLDGGFLWFSAWNRQLSNVEVTNYLRNPYQFLIPA